jgi:hypothetical protein
MRRFSAYAQISLPTMSIGRRSARSRIITSTSRRWLTSRCCGVGSRDIGQSSSPAYHKRSKRLPTISVLGLAALGRAGRGSLLSLQRELPTCLAGRHPDRRLGEVPRFVGHQGRGLDHSSERRRNDRGAQRAWVINVQTRCSYRHLATAAYTIPPILSPSRREPVPSKVRVRMGVTGERHGLSGRRAASLHCRQDFAGSLRRAVARRVYSNLRNYIRPTFHERIVLI